MSFSLGDLETLSSSSRPEVEWEEVPCPLCASPRWRLLIEAPDRCPSGPGLWFAVVECQSCGLCYTNPRPSPRSLQQFYSSTYVPHQPLSASLNRKRWSRLRWPGQAPHCWPVQGQGRLLDFGCGNGRFLVQMRTRGWQVMGVENCEAVAQQVREQLDIPVLTGSLPHPDLAAVSFDLITMWHSLEHTHQPLAVLHAAHELLDKAGQLVVAVPNIDSLPFRWFGYAWYGLDLPRHLIHFSPRTLQRMLRQAGFRVQSVRMIRHSSWLRCSARAACQQGRPTFWQRWVRHRLAANLLTWYSYLTDQADCILVTARRGS